MLIGGMTTKDCEMKDKKEQPHDLIDNSGFENFRILLEALYRQTLEDLEKEHNIKVVFPEEEEDDRN